MRRSGHIWDRRKDLMGTKLRVGIVLDPFLSYVETQDITDGLDLLVSTERDSLSFKRT